MRIAPVLALSLALVPSLPAQDWSNLQASQPPGRQLGRIAHDAARNRTVLFGGYSRSLTRALADTWLFDGTSWTQATTSVAPSARDTFGLCYDGTRNLVTLFGGVDSQNFPQGLNNETWEWNGSQWTRRSPANAPSARFGCAIVHDSRRGVTVLFGGATSAGYLNDTWEWDGTNWKQIQTSNRPTGRSNHGMAFDALRQRVVLFGGSLGGSQRAGDTWEYDGTDWKQIQTGSSPLPRTGCTMAYDVIRRVVLLHGGLSSGTVALLGDTWEYDGNHWYQYRRETPLPARTNGGMAYVLQRQAVVAFGGAGNAGDLADTWEFGGRKPSFATFGTSCSGSTGSLRLDASSLPALGGTLNVTAQNTPANALTIWILGLAGTGTIAFGGCDLLLPPHVINPLTANAQGVATLSFGIPNNPAFAGLELPLQAAYLDSLSNTGVVLSNVGRARLY